MPSPLSVDLRRRVVAAYENENRSYAEIGARFCVGEATVNRWVHQHRRTGSVEPKVARGGKAPQLEGEKLDAVHILVLEKPDRTEHEIAQALATIHSLYVSRSTVSRALARLGLTRKKSHSQPRSETANASPSSVERSQKKSKRST